MELDLNNKRILITGGARGIGFAAAEAFAQEGCALRLVSRDPRSLEQALSRLRAAGYADVQGTCLDLRAPGAIDEVARLYAGEVDVLVNNAGDIPQGTLMDIGPEQWRSAWDLKVYGYIDLARAVYARMRERGSGVIVNVIGLAGGVVTMPGYIAGTSGNAALDAFTRALGATSPADGIRVVGVHPGMVATDRQIVRWRKRAAEELGDAERWAQLTTHLPFGRLAHPAEVARVIVFLASGAASYMSGTCVVVDGGLGQQRPVR
jgi:3-oxoacyl-[acyl-carrier protein] reductase